MPDVLVFTDETVIAEDVDDETFLLLNAPVAQVLLLDLDTPFSVISEDAPVDVLVFEEEPFTVMDDHGGEVLVIESGGPRGPQGPPGMTLITEHIQLLPAATWTWEHGLDHDPYVVLIYNESGELCDEYTWTFPTPETIQVGFDIAFAGTARVI